MIEPYKVRYQRTKDVFLKRLRDDPEYAANRHLVARYGITLEQARVMYDAQGGRCALCDKPGPFRGQNGLVLDHNHATNVVRKMLCRGCNAALAYVENVTWLNRALQYLK